MIGIYKIVSPSGKIYIGQSIDIMRRKHCYHRGQMHDQPRLKRSILKYGWTNHTFTILEICELENLNVRERYFQEKYNCIGPEGLNCILTNTKHKKRRLSEDTKRKMSEGQIGRKHTAETILKIKKYHVENPRTKEAITKSLKAAAEVNRKNLAGSTYNYLTAIRRAFRKDHWFFKCQCGNIKAINAQSVKCGSTKSCGCKNKEFKQPNKTKYNRLTLTHNTYIKKVVWAGKPNNILMHEAICDCGTIKYYAIRAIMGETTKSCGCISKERGQNKKQIICDLTTKQSE